MVHYGLGNIVHIKDEVEIVRADIRFSGECMEATDGVDAVAHLAALIHVDRSRRYPQLFWETNVGGTMNMLEAARHHDTKFLQMSTCEMIGHIPEGKAEEKYPFKQPRSPYASSKFAAEAYCHSYRSTYDMDLNIARCFNVFGPRQKAGSKGAVISTFVTRALHGEPLLIYGSGEQTRDYTDVRDIARGLSLLLRTNLRGELIHFCSGVERSIKNIAWIITKSVPNSPDPVHIEGRPGELVRSVGDNTKAARALGWHPEISFGKTIKDVIKYITNTP